MCDEYTFEHMLLIFRYIIYTLRNIVLMCGAWFLRYVFKISVKNLKFNINSFFLRLSERLKIKKPD